MIFLHIFFLYLDVNVNVNVQISRGNLHREGRRERRPQIEGKDDRRKPEHEGSGKPSKSEGSSRPSSPRPAVIDESSSEQTE